MPIVRGDDDFLPVKFSTRICLLVLAAYAAVALFGEVQYRVARWRDVTPVYNHMADVLRDRLDPALRSERETK